MNLDQNLFYGRYVDDIVIIHPKHEYLLEVKNLIQTYLKENLNLSLHPKKISIQHYAKGFPFIGAYIKPGRIYPGKRLKKSFYQKMYMLNKEWEKNKSSLNQKLIEHTLCTVNSYFGLFKHFDSWRIKLKGWNILNETIRSYFRTNENLDQIWIEENIKYLLREKKRQLFTKPLKRNRKYDKMTKQRGKSRIVGSPETANKKVRQTAD